MSSLEGGGSWRLELAGQGDVRTLGGFPSLDEIKLSDVLKSPSRVKCRSHSYHLPPKAGPRAREA